MRSVAPLRSAVAEGTLWSVVERQSRGGFNVSPSIKERFAKRLRERVRERLGVPEDKAATWISEKTGVRWQTAQFWLEGKSLPYGQNIAKLAKAVGMDPRELLGEAAEEPTYESWKRFRSGPEGLSLTDSELAILSVFWWPREPKVRDWRALLTVVRSNASED